MAKVGHPISGNEAPPDSLNQVLHDQIIGNDSENKHFIFSRIAMSSMPIIHEFDHWGLTDYMFAFGVMEFIPNIVGGCTLFDVVAQFPNCGTSNLRICPTCSGLTQKWARQSQTCHSLRRQVTLSLPMITW